MLSRLFAGTVAFVVLMAPVVSAQELSVEELWERFLKQKEAFSAAEESGMGQTRGLKLVTVEDAKPATGAQSGASVEASNGGGAAEQVVPAAIDPNKPLVFGQLDPELQVNLQIKFGFDSAALDASEKPKLAKLCIVLKETDINQIRIVGHTDASGGADYNERLSILRAQEVARHLVNECGIAASRLQTIGLGERFPFNRDNPRADENRRVEFQALS